ncbi:hypothetical protein O181_005901 [Austropuccinia psidii MF-1]|uniref:Uncharacterized protein n=1 Tax=Austropuccinia psidii MF-1 TaxID=1389203 RepID=A0A9Q3BI60_9BASI|nr:hypothetical protein [Austropuccinia psidii MF-1]
MCRQLVNRAPFWSTNLKGAKWKSLAMDAQDESHGFCKPPFTLRRVSPQDKSNPFQKWAQGCRNQEWVICGIIYHYAPFFLGNPVVLLSGLQLIILNQVTNPSIHFKEILQSLNLAIHCGIQKTIQAH